MSRAGDPNESHHLKIAVESAPVGLLLVDASGGIVMVNGEAERVFGYPRAELLGKPVETLLPNELRQGHVELRNSFLAHPEARVMGGGRELHGLRRDGTLFPVEIGLTPSPAADGLFVIAAVADVSARKKLEDELRQAQKLAALGELTGSVAHDFNNLLTTIIAPLDLCIEHCQDTFGDNHPASEELRVARASAERAVTLTRQLLAFSRKRIFRPVPLNLNDLVERSQAMLERLVSPRASLKVVLDADLPAVNVDPSLFDQVLLNLTMNAAEAIEGRGTVWIRTSAGTTANEVAVRVLLEVSDTGKGMDPGTRARVFEPFFTTKPNGTGLGLATVHGVVAQAGGTIDIQSEPGRGTTFRISLEATSELPEAIPRGDPQTTVRHRGGSGEVIVVVEDEDALRGVVCRALTRSGYRTREAADGNAALHLLSAEESMPDLIITDIGLPDMDGIELAARVRRLVPEMPILYTSGHSEEEVIKKFALARPKAFLEKPYSVQALLAKVGETIGSAAA